MGNYANFGLMEPDAYKGVAVLEKGAYLSLEASSAFEEVSDEVSLIKGNLEVAP